MSLSCKVVDLCMSDLQFTSTCFLRSVDRSNWLHKGDSSFPSQWSSNPQPHTLAKQKSDLTLTKGAAAQQYYLSKARYSPSSTTSTTTHQRGPSGQSRISAQSKAAFGSTQPRFGYLGNPESSAFKKKYPSASVLPSMTKPGQTKVANSGRRGEGAVGAGGSWRTAGVYHPSIGASTTKSAYPGRTDWRAK